MNTAHSPQARQAAGPAAPRVRREPKQERARRTKSQIMLVAAEMFAEQGYPTVTLQDVAERASMTKGAVYFHFANKEALAVAVVREHYRRWQEVFDSVNTQPLTPLDSVLTALDRTFETIRDEVVVQAGIRLQIERSLIKADLPQPFVGWVEWLTPLIGEAVHIGQLRPGTDPPTLARVLVAAFFGAQHISDVLTGRADYPERYAEIRDYVLRGVLV